MPNHVAAPALVSALGVIVRDWRFPARRVYRVGRERLAASIECLGVLRVAISPAQHRV